MSGVNRIHAMDARALFRIRNSSQPSVLCHARDQSGIVESSTVPFLLSARVRALI